MTTTPKRKRGQHAKRHPWSNAVAKRGKVIVPLTATNEVVPLRTDVPTASVMTCDIMFGGD
jgi:hypothetical protein